MTADAKAVIAKLKTGLYLNNEWVDAEDGKTFPVENPATGEVLAHVADGSVADAERAIAAAGAAQAGWAKTSPRERSEILRRAYEDRKSTHLNSSHVRISYAGFCLKRKTRRTPTHAPPPLHIA